MTAVTAVTGTYIDVALVEDEGPLTTGAAPMEHILSAATTAGLIAIPMVTPTSSSRTISAAAAATTHGIAIRLTIPEWPSRGASTLTGLIHQLHVQPSDVDLFLDVGDTLGPFTPQAVAREVHHLNATGPFRTVTFTATAWPTTPPAGVSNHEIPRQDFTTFTDVVAECAAQGLPVPDYADWNVTHPDPSLNVDPKILNIAATFRYAATDKWVFGKGQLYKANGGKGLGGKAVRPMLSALVAHPEYACVITGDTETWIADVLAGRATTGNAGTWRQWAVLRHLALTAHQLST